jgi:hypothetical protein
MCKACPETFQRLENSGFESSAEKIVKLKSFKINGLSY